MKNYSIYSYHSNVTNGTTSSEDGYTDHGLKDTTKNYKKHSNHSNATNGTTSTDYQIVDHGFNQELTVALLVGILFFNTLVITLLRNKKSRMAFTVKNLALSDISVGIFYLLPNTLFTYYALLEWNSDMCAAYGYLHMFAFYVSTNNIVAMTLDRMFAIQLPFSTVTKTPRYRYGLACCTWALGAVVSTPHAWLYKMDGKSCLNSNTYGKTELWITGSLLIFIPVVVMVTCYGIMIWRINKRHIWFSSLRREGNVNCTRHQYMVSKSRIKTIKLLLVVVIVYVLCWAPIFVGSLLFIHEIVADGVEILSTIYALAPLNSLMNPIIFLVLYRKMFTRKEIGSGHSVLLQRLSSRASRHSRSS